MDSYTFRRKGHKEQFKANIRVLDSLTQADGFLQEASTGYMEALSGAKGKIAEGIRFINHRQKCIKLTDSSVHGWKVVQEYVCNALADDSDDEKRIQKAYNQAERKARRRKRYSSRRYRPYTPTTEVNKQCTELVQSATMGTARPGSCVRCGKLGHWRADCKTVIEPSTSFKNVQISSLSNKSSFSEKESDNDSMLTEVLSISSASPVGRLKIV